MRTGRSAASLAGPVMDRFFYRIERGLAFVSLLGMAWVVSLDAIQRRYTAEDNKLFDLIFEPLKAGGFISSEVASGLSTLGSGLLVFLVLCLAFWTRWQAKVAMPSVGEIKRWSWKTLLVYSGAALVLVWGALYLLFGSGDFESCGDQSSWKLSCGLFPNGLTWSQPLALIFTLWVAFIGASLASQSGRHLRVEALLSRWPDKWRPVIALVSGLLSAAFCLLVARLAWRYVTYQHGDFADAEGLGGLHDDIDLPRYQTFLIVPLAYGVMALRFLSEAWRGYRYGEWEKKSLELELGETESPKLDCTDSESPKSSGMSFPILAGLFVVALLLAWSGGAFLDQLSQGVFSGVLTLPLSLSTAFAVLALVLLIVLALGLPLFVAIGCLAITAFATLAEGFSGLSTLDIIADQSAHMLGKNVLIAIPCFVTSGAIMSQGGIARRLVRVAECWIGWLPGGLAIASVLSCLYFASISGSSPVTLIAIGSMMMPELLRAGYPRKFNLGLLSSAGSLGILIPPSIPMLVYAVVAGGRSSIDVSELFLAGVGPGLLLAGLFSLYCVWQGYKIPRKSFDLREALRSIREGIWALSLPMLILPGIYLGLFTATEAAAISVIYALLIEIGIHRELSWSRLPKLLEEAAVTMGSILVIMVFAFTVNAFLVEEKVPDRIVEWIQTLQLSPIGFLLIVNLLLLAVGAFMDSISAIMIVAPLLAPIAVHLGIDPVHLGIIFIVNLEIGYLTPPIGINLFVASSVFRRPLGEVVWGTLPFISLMVVGLLLVTYVPSIAIGPVEALMREPTVPASAGSRSPVLAPASGRLPAIDREQPSPKHRTPDSIPEPEPKANRVLTIEEMMKQADDLPAEGNSETDESKVPPDSKVPVPKAKGRVLTIEEMMQQVEKGRGED